MSFIDEWRENPKWWFAGVKYDSHIVEKFGHLLDTNIDRLSLESILIYDQLPRHIFRNMQCNHIIEFFLQKAIAITQKLKIWEISDDEFAITFSLMPLRHSNISELVNKAIEIAWSKRLTRFLKACYERCPLIGPQLYSPSLVEIVFDKAILSYNPKSEIDIDNSFGIKTSKKIIISISGGVDSMVASYMLRKNVVAAVHINYCNRDTSFMESNFVRWWCNKLKIPLYVRDIVEIKRKQCMDCGLRETYEKYTKKVRFACYKNALCDFPDSVIVLGHNKCDILENIFTNIYKYQIDDLNGMVETAIIDEIPFWRPLLDKSKLEIINFAHQYKIPYLPNSTPSWSQRGQIRDKIVPTLNNWNIDFCSSLYNLSNDLKDLFDMTFDNIKQNLKIDEKDNIEIDFKKFKNSRVYWRILFKIFNICASSKSIDNLIIRINNQKNQNMVYVLNKSYVIKFNSNHKCIISKSS